MDSDLFKKQLIDLESIALSKKPLKDNYINLEELYKLIDFFIDNLKYTFKSYGISGLSYKRITNDEKYSVFPLGRLIIVKINTFDITYEELEKKIKIHYSINNDVNDVYLISKGRSLAIDCRY